MIQNQAEGEESEEEIESAQKQRHDPSSSKKHRSSDKRKDKFSEGRSDDQDNKDETDTQKMAKDMGLHSPDMEDVDSHKRMPSDDMDDEVEEKDRRLLRDLEQEYEEQLAKEGLIDKPGDSNSRKKSDKAHGKHEDMEDEEPRFSDLDFYGKNPPDHKQVMVDDEDEEALMMKNKKKNEVQESKNKQENKKDDKKSSGKKQAVDVLNDPLLPEGVDFGFKKNKRHDSLGGGGSFKGNDLLGDQEDDDDLLVIDNLEDLDEEQRYMVLQHLFEEYQKDPDSFPEDQKELLEQEMMKLYQKAELEGDLDDEGEYEEEDLRMASSSNKKKSNNDKSNKRKWMDDDEESDQYEKEFHSSNKKAKPRPLHDEDDDSQDERMHMDGELNIPSDKMPKRQDNSDVEDDNKHKNQMNHDEDEDEDEKYMKEIIEQQKEAKAEREEQQQQLEDHDDNKMDENEEEDDGQAIEITEEEFKKLPPEEQERMLMLIRQQQMAQEGEGEGDGETPQVDQEYLNALQQQMMQQEQLAQMRRMKAKKPKKAKKRPSTAKYGWNSRSTKLQSRSMRRPVSAKKKRSKSKAKKRRIQEQKYMNQLQQQQILQQMAMQQRQQQELDDEQIAMLQQNIANIQPVDEDGNPVELTPEQLAEFQNNLLQQQLQAHQDAQNEAGDEQYANLTPEQLAMLQQQAYEQQLREQSMRRKKARKRSASKRRKSKTKKTKKPKRKQYMDEQTAFLMMLQQNPELQQQLLQQQQMQAMAEGGDPNQMYNVDKIEEEENEESPLKSQPHDMKNHERPTEESHHTGEDVGQHHDTDEGIYEEDENQQMLANLSPEELAYLQQKAAQEQQMMGYPQEDVQGYYSPHQGNLYVQQNNVQRNIINQNEALNNMFKNYIAEMKKNEMKKAKRRLKKQQKNRRRSFAAAYGGRGGTHNVIPYKKGLDLKSKIRRDVKQVMLAKKIYMLANEIERNRLLEEKRRMAELRRVNKTKKKTLKSSMKNRFKDQMALLKQSIESERMDRKIAKFVRTQAMQQWKRDLSRKQPQIQLPMGSYA